MKRVICILSIIFLALVTASAKIHTIGDSTMADYDQNEPDQKGMFGWGQVFGDYFANGMTVKNWGDRGESARSFYKKFWANAKKEIKKGDLVLIQFGHNDQKSVTTDVYREYLAKFISETRNLGATPVLVTSICRKLFDGTQISRLGRIDNGKAHGVSEEDHTYDYPYHMKKVADSLKVQCLDLTTACKQYMESWGPQGCKQFFPAGGSTHTNELGARVNAQLVAQLMYKANILKKYIAIKKINLPKNEGKVAVVADHKNESDTAEEDWNYYMVKTGADGYAVFGNLSGENLAVPVGLTAYGIIPGSESHLVKLVKVGNVIPVQTGVIVRGKPNTEYSLTATNEPPTFKRQKQNLLKVNAKVSKIQSYDGNGYNYLFTSTRKNITFIPADGKSELRIKRAYLTSPAKAENITIERRPSNNETPTAAGNKKTYKEAITTKTYYVSPTGNDKSNGESSSRAFATLAKAQSLVAPGDTIYMMPGIYKIKEKDLMAPNYQKVYAVAFLLDKSGTAQKPINYIGLLDAEGNRPVFDFSEIKPDARITGFLITGSYIHIKNVESIGIQVTQANHTQSENFRIFNASHNKLENISAHDGMGIGFYLIKKCAHNYFINCDAYNNYDTVSENGKGGNSDGFGCHPGTLDSEDNIFIGCRAWYNSDDGYDLINAQAPVKFLYSIAYKNGLATINGEDKKIADGNGFKCGGYGMGKVARTKFEKAPMHIAENCISAENRANGFYANHHLGGLHFIHCSAYRNGGANYNMTNRKDRTENGNSNVNGYGHILENCLSYGSDAIKSSKHLSMVDGNKKDCTVKNNSFSWNPTTQKWDNDQKLTKNSFKSLDAKELIVKRDKEGMLPAFIFLAPVQPSEYGYNFTNYRHMVEEYRNK